MKTRRPILAGAGAVLALAIPSAAQLGVSNQPPPGPRTGMIVGQVVDPATGNPVSEAIVRLSLQGYAEDVPDSPNDRVMADAEGRFFFSGLPPGKYYMEATKEGYARGTYGQRRPWGPNLVLDLAAGERRTDVELPVWKYAVIGGTVVDEAGEPVVGITVRALEKSVFAGRTRYGNLQLISEPAAVTDDRGMFRLSALSPGTYVVVVPSTHTSVPAQVLANPDAALRRELFWGGVLEVAPLGQPRTQQLGEFALMTSNRVLIPPPPTASGRMQVYRTTYFPSAPRPALATPITVKAGEERTDVTIALHPVPAVRVSGRLVAPDGSVPPPMTIRLVGESMAEVATMDLPSGPDYVGLHTASAFSDGLGRFSLLGVPPGEYVIRQANRFLERPLREGNPAYWVSQPLTVGREEIEDLAVELREALRVEGKIEFRSSKGGEPTGRLAAALVFGTPFGEPGQFGAQVDRETLTFSTVAAGGQYIIRAVQIGGTGWVMQSVTLDGKDITDRAFTLQGDATSFVVTFTDAPSKVTGTVTDTSGGVSTRAMVLAFPVDPQRWSGYGDSPRSLRSVPSGEGGVYTFDHLPPGEYYVIAVDAADADGWQDPAKLETLALHASRLSIAAGDPLKTLDLRVRAIQ
jgi:hypothetical protein